MAGEAFFRIKVTLLKIKLIFEITTTLFDNKIIRLLKIVGTLLSRFG